MSFVEKDQLNDAKAKVRADYGENRKISDGNYDKSLAVKCINGTFVGRKRNPKERSLIGTGHIS